MSDGTLEQINPSPRFKGEILKQVYRVWLFRKLLPVFLLEIAVFALILYRLGRSVFIQRVLENALNVFFVNPSGIVSFFFSAFANASVATKVLTLLAAVLVAFLLRHLTQGFLRLILVRENYFSRAGK